MPGTLPDLLKTAQGIDFHLRERRREARLASDREISRGRGKQIEREGERERERERGREIGREKEREREGGRGVRRETGPQDERCTVKHTGLE